MFDNWKKKFGGVEDEPEDIEFKPAVSEPEDEQPEPAPAPASATITPTSAAKLEIKMVRPESFDDVATVADHLLTHCVVVINLEMLDPEEGRRMLDFLNGVTYSIGGEIQQVSPTTFIASPEEGAFSDGN